MATFLDGIIHVCKRNIIDIGCEMRDLRAKDVSLGFSSWK